MRNGLDGLRIRIAGFREAGISGYRGPLGICYVRPAHKEFKHFVEVGDFRDLPGIADKAELKLAAYGLPVGTALEILYKIGRSIMSNLKERLPVYL